MMKADVNKIYDSFNEKYSYISVDKSVVERFVNENPRLVESKSEDVVLDLLQDYVCSQMMYDEIEY